MTITHNARVLRAALSVSRFSGAKLKAVYDTAEDIPEGFDGLFEEKEGKHILIRGAIEGLVSQADVDRVSSALKKEKDDHKATKAKLQSFGDMDAEKLVEMQTELEELRAKGPGEDDKTIEDRVQKLVDIRLAKEKGPLERENAKLKKEAADAVAENTALKADITRGKINDAVRGAAGKHKIVAEAVDDVLLNAERIFEIDAETGKIVTKDNVGVTPGLEPDVWLNDMQAKRPFWWPAANGGGAIGGGPAGGPKGNNPFMAASWDKTAQGIITRDNPQKADQLAKQAGFPDALAAGSATKALK